MLAADPDVSAFFLVSGTGANVVLTTKASQVNDATLNISIANGTCTGLTAAPTSANTTAGVAGTYRGLAQGVYLADTTNGVLYQQSGSTLVPAWTRL